MRKLVIAVVVVVVLGGGAVGARWAYHRIFRDPLKDARALLARGDVQGAALELRDAVQRNPSNAEAQARLGAVQLLLHDPIAAERELEAARSLGYKGTDLRPLMARALLGQKRYTEVLSQFVPDGLPPASAADVLVTRGIAALAEGDAEAARSSAEAAERLAPTMPDAILLAARAAIAGRQPGWALACLDRALKLKPDLMPALLLKANLLRAEARPREALSVLDAAVAAARVPVDMATARLSRAGALLALGEDAKAMTDLDVVTKAFPKSPGGNYLKALAQVRARDWTAADASLEEVQPVIDRLPRGEYYFALVKSNLNQLEQAAEAITHYTTRFPTDPDGWRLLARIDLLAGRKDGAEQALAKLVGLPVRPTTEEVTSAAAVAETPQELTQLASLQIGTGDTGGAARELERSLEMPTSPAIAAARAVVAALRIGDIDRATTELDRLRRMPKVSAAQVAALSGAIRLSLLDLKGARAAFEEGLKTAPESGPLKLDLARVLLLQGHGNDAEALLAPVLKQSPASTLVLPAMLQIYATEQQPDRIRDALAAARAAAPNAPGPLLMDARLKAELGDVAGAEAELEAAPPELADQPQVTALRAGLLARLGRLKDATDLQTRLLQEAPRNIQLRRELMTLLLAQHQGDAAIALAREGLQVEPGNAALLSAEVTATLRASGLDAALAAADKLRQDPVNLPASRLLRGDVYMAAGRPADAAAAYAAEARAVAPFGALVVAEANALRAAGKVDEARSQLDQWLAAQPDPTVADALSSLEIEAGRMDAAAAALDKVLAMRPDDPIALNNLAWVYQQQHNPKDVTMARRAYLIAPSGQTADTLGWILTQQGEPATGLLLLRQAAAQLRSDPSVYYHLAAALNDNGQGAEAARILDAVLKSGAKFTELDAARTLRQKLPAPPAAPPAAAAAAAAASAPAAAPAQ